MRQTKKVQSKKVDINILDEISGNNTPEAKNEEAKVQTSQPDMNTPNDGEKKTSKLTKATVKDPFIASQNGARVDTKKTSQNSENKNEQKTTNTTEASTKKKVQLRITQEENNKLEAHLMQTITTANYRSVTGIIQAAIDEYVDHLQQTYNNNQPFERVKQEHMPLARSRIKANDTQPLIVIGIYLANETLETIRGAIIATAPTKGIRSISAFIRDAIDYKIN